MIKSELITQALHKILARSNNYDDCWVFKSIDFVNESIDINTKPETPSYKWETHTATCSGNTSSTGIYMASVTKYVIADWLRMFKTVFNTDDNLAICYSINKRLVDPYITLVDIAFINNLRNSVIIQLYGYETYDV